MMQDCVVSNDDEDGDWTFDSMATGSMLEMITSFNARCCEGEADKDDFLIPMNAMC